MTLPPGKGEGLSEYLTLTSETGSMAKELLFFFLIILFLFLFKSCRTPEMTTTVSSLAPEP